MTSSWSLDTNILIYAADSSLGQKQQASDDLLEKLIRNGGMLPSQCLHEFYSLTTRRSLLSPPQAELIVHRLMQSLVVVPTTLADSVAAMRLQQQHRMQFFDALLLTTARRAGCDVFLSEDMQDGHDYGGITVLNPFSPSFVLSAL